MKSNNAHDRENYSQLNTNETATMRLIDSNILGQSEGPYDKKQNNTTQHNTKENNTKQYNTVLMKTIEEKRTHNRAA